MSDPDHKVRLLVNSALEITRGAAAGCDGTRLALLPPRGAHDMSRIRADMPLGISAYRAAALSTEPGELRVFGDSPFECERP
jgi:hypothetical protein